MSAGNDHPTPPVPGGGTAPFCTVTEPHGRHRSYADVSIVCDGIPDEGTGQRPSPVPPTPTPQPDEGR